MFYVDTSQFNVLRLYDKVDIPSSINRASPVMPDQINRLTMNEKASIKAYEDGTFQKN